MKWFEKFLFILKTKTAVEFETEHLCIFVPGHCMWEIVFVVFYSPFLYYYNIIINQKQFHYFNGITIAYYYYYFMNAMVGNSNFFYTGYFTTNKATCKVSYYKTFISGSV